MGYGPTYAVGVNAVSNLDAEFEDYHYARNYEVGVLDRH